MSATSALDAAMRQAGVLMGEVPTVEQVTSAQAETSAAHEAMQEADVIRSGRAKRIADMVAAGIPVDATWIESYMEARDRAREARVAWVAASEVSSALYNAWSDSTFPSSGVLPGPTLADGLAAVAGQAGRAS